MMAVVLVTSFGLTKTSPLVESLASPKIFSIGAFIKNVTLLPAASMASGVEPAAAVGADSAVELGARFAFDFLSQPTRATATTKTGRAVRNFMLHRFPLITRAGANSFDKCAEFQGARIAAPRPANWMLSFP